MSDIIFTDNAFLRAPQKALLQLSQQGPVISVKVPNIGKAALVTGSEALIDLLKSPHRFSTNAKDVGKSPLFSKAGIKPDISPFTNSLLIKDGVSHREQRQLLDQAIKKCGIKSLRPNIAVSADTLLKNARSPKKRPQNRIELMSQFALPLPALVMMELLGIPKEIVSDVLKWTLQIAAPQGMLPGLSKKKASQKLVTCLARLIDDKQALRPACLLAQLLLDSPQEEDKEQILQLSYFLLLSGHMSTANLISLGILTLLDHQDQLKTLQSDWTLAPSAVEEILRFASPALTTSARYAKENFTFHNHNFKRGDLVFGVLGASNMDPSTNIDALRFDISRDTQRQISFGAGAHFCAGAQLSHIICEVALQRLFTHWPEASLYDDQMTSLEWDKRFGIRKLKQFHIKTHIS